MVEHIIFAVILVILILLSVVGFKRAKKVSIYRYRNIAYMSVTPALGLILVLQLFNLIRTGGSIGFLEFILKLPEWFALVSMGLFGVLAVWMAVSNLVLIKKEGMSLKNAFGTIMYAFVIVVTIAVYVLVYVLDAYKGIGNQDNIVMYFIFNMLPFLLYCLIDYAECIIIGIMVLGFVAAMQKPAYDKDFIIIPGCSISKDGGLLPLLKGRVNRAINYAWMQEIACGKPVHYIPSGGQGSNEIMSEGSAMELYLLSHSAEDYEVFPEKESKNTYENFLFSKRIVDSKNKDAKVAFSTTNYHMFRCGLLARKIGLDAEGIASSTKWYFWPNGFAREIVAIMAMTRKHHLCSVGIIALVSIALTFLSRL